jgi:DNA-binding transcriptional LysR family regulator
LDVIMDMDQIRTFVAVARGRSFSGAAATLHRSQPAISRRIELLEREFDIALFERLRGGSILTDAGAAFLPYAEIVLAAAADGAEALRAGRQGETGRIPLALVGTLANAALTNALRQFGKQYPKVRLELRTATSQEVSDLVQRGEATLGLRYSSGRHSGVVSQIIAEEQLVVVARPDHPLADGRRYQPGKLAGERWVAFPARNRRESFVQFLQRKISGGGSGRCGNHSDRQFDRPEAAGRGRFWNRTAGGERDTGRTQARHVKGAECSGVARRHTDRTRLSG